MGAADTEQQRSVSGGLSPRSRRWYFALAALWLIVTALAVVQWLDADDSRGHWLAGVQCVIGLFLATMYLVQAAIGRRL